MRILLLLLVAWLFLSCKTHKEVQRSTTSELERKEITLNTLEAIGLDSLFLHAVVVKTNYDTLGRVTSRVEADVKQHRNKKDTVIQSEGKQLSEAYKEATEEEVKTEAKVEVFSTDKIIAVCFALILSLILGYAVKKLIINKL